MLAAIVRFSVRHAGLVLGLAVALTGFGLLRMTGASLDVFPEFAPAQVVIQIEAPGLHAAAIEAQVTRPVEQAIGGLAGLTSLRSQSIPGLSVVTALFDESSDLHRDRQGVAERLAQAASSLPAGVVPNITPLTSSASTVLGIGLTSTTLDGVALRSLVEASLRPHLMAVPGIADVNVFGGALRQWQVQVDAQRLAQAGLSLTDLAAALRSATGVRAAGFIESDNQRIALTMEPPGAALGTPASAVIDTLNLTVVSHANAQHGGQAVLLRDVATVAEGGAPAFNAAQIDGQPGVFLLVQGQLGANTRDTTRALDAAIAHIRPVLERAGAKVHLDLFRPASFIETAVGNVRSDVLIGATLVIAVLFLFLFNLRTAVVSAVAIPLSLIAAVLTLQQFGIGLNIMVIGGLAIALGEVVDDAIIDCENIFRRLRENRALAAPRSAAQVVFDASMEVRSSVVYATFIVALVFTPLLTLDGVAGKLFAPLGLAYIAAIIASLVVALTVTPAMSLLLLRHAALPAADPPLVAWMKPRYRRLLLAIERRSTAVLSAAALCMAAGIGVLPLLGGEFIPPLKEGHYIVHVSAVPGTSLAESLRVGKQVSDTLLAIPGVKSVAQWVGRSQNGADTFGPHYSEMEVEVGQVSGAEQRRILQDIRRALSGDDGDDDRSDEQALGSTPFPGLVFGVNTFLTERIGETVSGYPADVVVNLYGPDLDALDRDGKAVAAMLSQLPGATDVQLQAPPGAPELSVRLRPEQLALHAMNAGEVMDAVQIAFDGLVVGQHAGAVKPTPVALVLAPSGRRDVSQVEHLPLRTPGGRLIELRDVADVALVEGRYKVLREGGQRVQTVIANLKRGHDPEDFVAQLRTRLAAHASGQDGQGGQDGSGFAAGNHAEVTGAAEAQAQARNDLLVASALATLGVGSLLLLAFGSLRHTLLTAVNLPFALIGGVVAVLATGGWLSLGSVVGFVTLFGITLRNSIMLVSHYQHLVQVEGQPWNLETALRGAEERLPSILMTALVTALGLLPLALGSAEPGREIEGPMAIIIVGGLISSTVLNLLVLPTVMLRHGRFGPAAPPSAG
ncbi:MAG: efflux RND transporter permease subunit [Burkholderiaceae bacterium]|nr:efflux RND transporter permease subunit [Burkholderiaceae bacterium]